MPAKGAWAKWVEETMARLDRIEPLLPDEIVRQNRRGRTEVLGWHGSPTAKVVCGPGDELRLERIEIAAFQIIELPRLVDNPDERDEGPAVELDERFPCSLPLVASCSLTADWINRVGLHRVLAVSDFVRRRPAVQQP